MFVFYIIYSATLNKYYLGHTEDFDTRLQQHNSGMSTFTSVAVDWILAYREHYATRKEARDREMSVKRKKSRKYIEWLTQQKPL